MIDWINTGHGRRFLADIHEISRSLRMISNTLEKMDAPEIYFQPEAKKGIRLPRKEEK